MYEGHVIAFAAAMQREINNNSHKRGWDRCRISWLRKRLKQEFGELERAIKSKQSAAVVVSEAADVANFAMMIADNYTMNAKP